MSSTDVGYAAMRLAMLLCKNRYCHRLCCCLRVRYAVSGTDITYGVSATRCRVLYVLSGTDTAYGATRQRTLTTRLGPVSPLSSYACPMRCPVLTWPTLRNVSLSPLASYACAMRRPVLT
eukprot:3941181-Rhodomonas_salina.2